jgi:hypothetical protein
VKTGCGVLVVCALAAQQQGEPADEAVEVNANCTHAVHNHHKYTYRQKYCKTFPSKIAEVRKIPCLSHHVLIVPEAKWAA